MKHGKKPTRDQRKLMMKRNWWTAWKRPTGVTVALSQLGGE